MTDAAAPKWETDAREQIKTQLKKFAKPLADLVQRDANEGDTRVLVTDMLCDALGFDKYEDLTTEYSVRGEFADYGIRIDKQLVAFVEVKRAAQDLNQRHLRQVETYSVKEGVEWMILTNGRVWEVFHVDSPPGSPISTHPVITVDLMDERTVAQKADDLFVLHKSAWKRQRINELWEHKAATSPQALAAVLLAPTVVDELRKEIRRRSNYNPDPAELVALLRDGVIRPGLA